MSLTRSEFLKTEKKMSECNSLYFFAVNVLNSLLFVKNCQQLRTRQIFIYDTRWFFFIAVLIIECHKTRVDWSTGSQTINYARAVNRVIPVGRVLGTFIDFLYENGALRFNELTLVGFSLGGENFAYELQKTLCEYFVFILLFQHM